jgi:hypothetical protein
VVVWTGLVWLRIGNVVCECDNEPSGSIKSWETIEWPNNWGLTVVYCRKLFA